MKYIGNKTRILDFIEQSLIESNIEYHNASVIDLFSGTGSVSGFFLKNNCSVISCDIMFYSICEQYRVNYFREYPTFNEIGFLTLDNVLEYLNNLNGTEGYFFNNFAPAGTEGRQYFSNDNAKRIDSIRETIEKWRDKLPVEKYYYLLGILMASADKVSNTSGTYGAYLKIWRSMALKRLTLEKPLCIGTGDIDIYQEDALECVRKNRNVDIIYLDPPYNERQYASNFHVLESICVYDQEVLKGKTGLRDYSKQKSNYCLKNNVYNELQELINNCDTNTIVMSYSNEGLLSSEEILRILKNRGNITVYEKEYRRFKTNSNTEAQTGLKELLFICNVNRRI